MTLNIFALVKQVLRRTPLWSVLKENRKISHLVKNTLSYVIFLLFNDIKQNFKRKTIVFAYIDERLFSDVYDKRYYHFVFHALVEAGYYVYIYKRGGISFEQYMCARNYQRQAYHLNSAKIVRYVPRITQDKILLTNLEDNISSEYWLKVLRLSCDISLAADRATSLLMPYIMHPFQYQLQRHKQLSTLRSSKRQVKIFFSGGVQEKEYNLPLPNNRITRFEVMRAMLSLPHVHLLRDKDQLHHILSNDYSNICLISDRNQFVIPDRQWLPTVARSDCFLCPPGMIMPMSHNVIEAMAVGTIPILNYPDWFHPPLKHGENCVVFDTRESLAVQIERVLAMQPGEIQRMRQYVCEYYDQHLTPTSFRRRLEALDDYEISVFVNTDQQQYAARVDEHSVAIGTSVA
jgi:glycosyltransferase involved in cell wall biosynthesis